MYNVTVSNWQTTFSKTFDDVDKAIDFAYSYSNRGGYHVTCQKAKEGN